MWPRIPISCPLSKNSCFMHFPFREPYFLSTFWGSFVISLSENSPLLHILLYLRIYAFLSPHQVAFFIIFFRNTSYCLLHRNPSSLSAPWESFLILFSPINLLLYIIPSLFSPFLLPPIAHLLYPLSPVSILISPFPYLLFKPLFFIVFSQRYVDLSPLLSIPIIIIIIFIIIIKVHSCTANSMDGGGLL